MYDPMAFCFAECLGEGPPRCIDTTGYTQTQGRGWGLRIQAGNNAATGRDTARPETNTEGMAFQTAARILWYVARLKTAQPAKRWPLTTAGWRMAGVLQPSIWLGFGVWGAHSGPRMAHG